MPSKKPNILFVCLGNICRSPMAHGVMEYYTKKEAGGLFGKIDSCGLGGEPEGVGTHSGTVNVLKKRLNHSFNKKVRLFRESDYD